MLDALKVLVLAAVLLLASAVALVAGSGNGSDALACVTGELARNQMQVKPDGIAIHTTRLLRAETLDEARRFACLEAPEPAVLGDWQPATYTGTRSASLEVNGVRSVEMAFGISSVAHSKLSIRVLNHVPERLPAVERFADAITEQIAVQGHRAILRPEGEDSYRIAWETDELRFEVFALLPGGLSVEADVLPVLESLR